MLHIFDNIESHLLPALTTSMEKSYRADFCVGYFNLYGWRMVDKFIEPWKGGEGNCCRLLVGMQRLPSEDFLASRKIFSKHAPLDNQTASQMKNEIAKEFHKQLITGAPSNDDEAGLRRLVQQIKSKKLIVKLFLKHPLHSKLYLLFQSNPIDPIVGYVGSSNLTLSGLAYQGELNVDVDEQGACEQLSKWFLDRWTDQWCVDISDNLVKIIEDSWAREDLIPPFHIYIKIAYHLSQEARAGSMDFRIPSVFGGKLLDFQIAAVKIAAQHINRNGGVIIGDVVGLGKTLMASALVKIFEDDYGFETLIICPKNLTTMWEDYCEKYFLRATVLSISQSIKRLPKLRRHRLVVIDESHNLRNRSGKRFRAIQKYIRENESKCILLSATPYNKTYLDLSNQLRLFIPEDENLGIRPEYLLNEIGESEFIQRYQTSSHTLLAFDYSEHSNDWKELMRLYLVRRTRSFIQENYALTDPISGRKFLTFEDGSRSYFPVRIPKMVSFEINQQYSRLFADDVVETVNSLNLPRYGLGNYIRESIPEELPNDEQRILEDLSRAGRRLMGFCRTNLFKRLESSGYVFLLSLKRHILRNFVFLHAIENSVPLPLGSTDTGLLDTHSFDGDSDSSIGSASDYEDDEHESEPSSLIDESDFRNRAAQIYRLYSTNYRNRFRWLNSHHFSADLKNDLISDSKKLRNILNIFGDWIADEDSKLDALYHLLTDDNPTKKVLIFSQFADTVRYLERELQSRGTTRIAAVTGGSNDPTEIAHRFSPVSNEKGDTVEEQLRVLIATDVLSEGQNLQDCAIVVNYDLPWAIIRLIQRAGRVDRIGQQSPEIICYSFLPADGIERLIQLRSRVHNRLSENAEVVGSDEAFFEDEGTRVIHDLYHEKSGIFDGEDETDVDLSSYAYQIWKNAIKEDPTLEKKIQSLQNVVNSSKEIKLHTDCPSGTIVYIQTKQTHDTLVWVNSEGEIVSENQFNILNAAKCAVDTEALPHHTKHHELVLKAVKHTLRGRKNVGGQLGRPSSARFRTYKRLISLYETKKSSQFDSGTLERVIDEIYRYPLRDDAADTLNRQIRAGISDEGLASLVIKRSDEGRLCQMHEEERFEEPRIICSMGLIDTNKNRND